jgi:hypothetical protein
MIRPVAVALVLSCFTSAAAQAQPAPAAGRPSLGARTEAKPAGRVETGRCKIGVIPIAGNLFTIQKIGPIALSNTYVRAAAEWGLDELVVSRVRAAAPLAAVRRIVYSREELARDNKPMSPFQNRNSNLNDFIRKVTTGANCVSLIESRTFLFAMMQVQIYDGVTLELIKEGPALIDDESLLARAYLNPVGGPYRALDERSFPASPAEAVANTTLREGVRALLTASLDKTLPAMLR